MGRFYDTARQHTPELRGLVAGFLDWQAAVQLSQAATLWRRTLLARTRRRAQLGFETYQERLAVARELDAEAWAEELEDGAHHWADFCRSIRDTGGGDIGSP